MIKRSIHTLSILYILQGSFFKRLWLPLLLQFLFSSLVYYYQTHFFDYQVPLSASVFTLPGIALAIFHGFCNNTAYDRYWEGRKLWGTLIWQSRNIARQVLNLSQVPLLEKQAFIRLVIAFAHSLRHQLRYEDPYGSMQRILTPTQYAAVVQHPFLGLQLSQTMGTHLADWQQQGLINGWEWQTIDATVREIAYVQSACERIANTPIPFAYFVLLHRTVYLYCFLLPFGLGTTIGWVTPIMATFVSYTFMALNEIVDEISEPFGTAENDLPLTMLSDTIETQLALLSQQTFTPEIRAKLPANIIQ